MKVLIIGAASFIGINLVQQLTKTVEKLTLVDNNDLFFNPLKELHLNNVEFKVCPFEINSDFDSILESHDVVYHLASTNIPATSNQKIPEELSANIIVTSKFLDACIRKNIKKVVFISSGGTVYGKEINCPIKEDSPTYPISSYGLQKVTIEKLLYLYHHQYGIDYRCIRLANPYGPYQRPNGILGVVTTFIDRILKNEKIIMYGDGSVVRDFIFIDDAIKGIINIAGDAPYKIFNLGCGYGTSIKDLLITIQKVLNKTANIEYLPERKNDVPENFLDISRYESVFGKLNPISLEEGILKTAAFLKNY